MPTRRKADIILLMGFSFSRNPSRRNLAPAPVTILWCGDLAVTRHHHGLHPTIARSVDYDLPAVMGPERSHHHSMARLRRAAMQKSCSDFRHDQAGDP
jgi:hypothetical protein